MLFGSRFEPGHRPPAAPPPAPPRSETRNELKSSAAFRITVRRTQLRRPRPGAVGDLDPDDAVPGPDRDRDRLPGSTRAGVPDAVAEELADQQDSRVSARVAGAEYLRDECAGGTRPLRPPGKHHALPDRHPGHHRTRPSPAASPRETGRAAGGRRAMHAQLRRQRQAGTTGLRGPSSVARPWSRPPSVAVRAKPTVPRTAPWPRFPSAIRPWTAQHDDPQRHKLAHNWPTEDPRQHENSQLAGGFRSVWQVLGSNQRRLSRRFYRPSLLPEPLHADQHGRASRRDSGPPPSAMRPCATGSGAVRATDGHGRRE